MIDIIASILNIILFPLIAIVFGIMWKRIENLEEWMLAVLRRRDLGSDDEG